MKTIVNCVFTVLKFFIQAEIRQHNIDTFDEISTNDPLDQNICWFDVEMSQIVIVHVCYCTCQRR